MLISLNFFLYISYHPCKIMHAFKIRVIVLLKNRVRPTLSCSGSLDKNRRRICIRRCNKIIQWCHA